MKASYRITRESRPPAYILVLSHVLFIPLFVLSYMYCKERLFGDSSWYLFRVINTENFVIEHMRLVHYPWQLFVILLVKCGASLLTVIKGYSVFHVAFFYACFVLSVHVLKDFRSGIFILLFQVFAISDLFYAAPMWEMWYGLALLGVQIALWRRSISFWPLHLILTLFIMLSYPYNIVVWPIALVLVFPWTFIRRHIWSLASLFLIVFAVKMLGQNNHESHKISEVMAQDIPAQIKAVIQPSYLYTLIHFYFLRYTVVSICLLISIYLLRKQTFKLLTFLLMIFASAFVINVAFGTNEYGSDGSAFESVYYIIPVFILLALIYNIPVLSSRIGQTFFAGCLLVIWGFGFWDILRVYDVYHERVLFTERDIAIGRYTGHEKLLYYDDNVRRFHYHYCMFAMPMESMLLSSSDSIHSSITVAEFHQIDSTQSWSALSPSSYVMTNNQLFDVATLNKKYFSIAAQPYFFLNKKECSAADIKSNSLNSMIRFDHIFNTDFMQRKIYHVNISMPPGAKLCSADSGTYWQVETDNGNSSPIIHSRQPLSTDDSLYINDFVVIASDSLLPNRNNYLSLMRHTQTIAKMKIP